MSEGGLWISLRGELGTRRQKAVWLFGTCPGMRTRQGWNWTDRRTGPMLVSTDFCLAAPQNTWDIR